MQRHEFEKLRHTPLIDRVFAYELRDKRDRTLLYGYTSDRKSWHVYFQDGYFWKVTGDDELVIKGPWYEFPIKDLIPDKRLYAQCCDYTLCQLLLDKGYSLPFTTYAECRHEGHYCGSIFR